MDALKKSLPKIALLLVAISFIGFQHTISNNLPGFLSFNKNSETLLERTPSVPSKQFLASVQLAQNSIVYGCLDPAAYNYDPNTPDDAVDDCLYAEGCADPSATNYDPSVDPENDYSYACIYRDGCTDPSATNYNEFAEYTDLNDCIYNGSPGEDEIFNSVIYGCTDFSAINYDSDATDDDGSCEYDEMEDDFFGCTDPTAINYDPLANADHGLCEYPIVDVSGCLDSSALNYNSSANIDDDSCEYPVPDVLGCTDEGALNFSTEANVDDGSCEYIEGCKDPLANNYNKDADITNNDLCEFDPLDVLGCIDTTALNFDTAATVDDGSCVYQIDTYGCTDANALNHNNTATLDDGSCVYSSTESSGGSSSGSSSSSSGGSSSSTGSNSSGSGSSGGSSRSSSSNNDSDDETQDETETDEVADITGCTDKNDPYYDATATKTDNDQCFCAPKPGWKWTTVRVTWFSKEEVKNDSFTQAGDVKTWHGGFHGGSTDGKKVGSVASNLSQYKPGTKVKVQFKDGKQFKGIVDDTNNASPRNWMDFGTTGKDLTNTTKFPQGTMQVCINETETGDWKGRNSVGFLHRDYSTAEEFAKRKAKYDSTKFGNDSRDGISNNGTVPNEPVVPQPADEAPEDPTEEVPNIPPAAVEPATLVTPPAPELPTPVVAEESDVCFDFTNVRTLRLGQNGNDVKELQKALNNLGYLVSATGAGSPGNETTFFRQKTKDALQRFQKDANLTVDGIAGRNTKQALMDACKEGKPATNTSEESDSNETEPIDLGLMENPETSDDDNGEPWSIKVVSNIKTVTSETSAQIGAVLKDIKDFFVVPTTINDPTVFEQSEILGCTNPNACNYEPEATKDVGNCVYCSIVTTTVNTDSETPNSADTATDAPKTSNTAFSALALRQAIVTKQALVADGFEPSPKTSSYSEQSEFMKLVLNVFSRSFWNKVANPDACEVVFPNTLGPDDTSVEISDLRAFLDTTLGKNLGYSPFYDDALRDAISEFQLMWFDQILAPQNLSDPSGVFDEATKSVVNGILGCADRVRLENGIRFTADITEQPTDSALASLSTEKITALENANRNMIVQCRTVYDVYEYKTSLSALRTAGEINACALSPLVEKDTKPTYSNAVQYGVFGTAQKIEKEKAQ